MNGCLYGCYRPRGEAGGNEGVWRVVKLWKNVPYSVVLPLGPASSYFVGLCELFVHLLGSKPAVALGAVRAVHRFAVAS